MTGTSRRCDDEQYWYDVRTGPASTSSAARPSYHPRLQALKPPVFVRPTVLTANYGDDGYLAALHAAPDEGPALYIPPTPAHTRRRRLLQAAQVKSEQQEPILISDDEDEAGDYSVVKVNRSQRPGIGASTNRSRQQSRDGDTAAKLMITAKGKAKAANPPAEGDVVVISDDSGDEEVGTLNMAQTYAALLECIGGSTRSSNPTGLSGQSMALSLSSDSSSSSSSYQSATASTPPEERAPAPVSIAAAVDGIASAEPTRIDAETSEAASERRRQGRAALPVPLRVPTAIHPSLPSLPRTQPDHRPGGPDRNTSRHAARRQSILNPRLPSRPQANYNNPRASLPSKPPYGASLPSKPSNGSPNQRPSSTYNNNNNNNNNRPVANPLLHPRSFVPAKSRWKGFTPCPQCNMLLSTTITMTQLHAHRASMPHRLALALQGNPEEILAASARRVQRIRTEADVKRARVRSLLVSLGRPAGMGGNNAEEGADQQLLALTRQSNRGFSLLETFGWEAGSGIGWKEWRRQRRIKKLARQEKKLVVLKKKGKVEGEKGGGGGEGDTTADTAAEEAAAGGDEHPGVPGAIAGPSSISKSSQEKRKHSKKKSADRKQQVARLDRLRAGGKSADSAIALSDSDDGGGGREDPDGSPILALQRGFMDFRFDSDSDSDDSSATSPTNSDPLKRRTSSHANRAAVAEVSSASRESSGSDSGTDVEWVGVETKRKKGESVHAWLLRKYDTTQRAKQVDAGKKRKRGQGAGADGEDVEESELEDDDEDEDDEGADADEEMDPRNGNGNGAGAGANGSEGPIPAVGRLNRLEPLAVSIHMQHALDRSGVGASSAYRTPLGRLATLGGQVDVLRERGNGKTVVGVNSMPRGRPQPFPFVRRKPAANNYRRA